MSDPGNGSVRSFWMLLALAAGGLLLLYRWGPGVGPVCLIHRFSGWHCPGCGMTRAIHALLMGEPGLAFLYNPLGMLALPVLAGCWLLRCLHAGSRREGREIHHGSIALAVLFVLIGYGILRNLPYWPILMPDHGPQ